MEAIQSSSLQTRERAEIERSSVEATLTADAALRSSVRSLARYERPPAHTHYPLEYAYHLLGDVRGKRIVDFGCGSGGNSVLLANRGAHVIGVDISEDLIRLARRRTPHERPLTDGELSGFAAPFATVRSRAFTLPHVALGQVLPWVKRRVAWLYRTDATLLARFPSLQYYAGVRVIEVTK